jgi:hypothetical protein
MDPLFLGFVTIEAAVIALVTFVDHPERLVVPGRSDRGFNCCEQCHRPLAEEHGAEWRLAGTCTRCERVQQWAVTDPDGPAPPVEPWGPVSPTPRRPSQDRPVFRPVRIPATPILLGGPAKEPGDRSAPAGTPGVVWIPGNGNGRTSPGAPVRGVPARGVPASPRTVPAPGVPMRPAAQATPPRGVPVRGAPSTTPRVVPGRTVPSTPAAAAARGAPAPQVLPAAKERAPRVRKSTDPMPVDPFVRDSAAELRNMETVKGTRVHRPRPERVRGFRDRRRNGGLGRPTAVGQKGFNCCEECGDPLPREHGREWRYAGRCPRCGHVQIWAV